MTCLGANVLVTREPWTPESLNSSCCRIPLLSPEHHPLKTQPTCSKQPAVWKAFNMTTQALKWGLDVEPRSGTPAQLRRQSVPLALPGQISRGSRYHKSGQICLVEPSPSGTLLNRGWLLGPARIVRATWLLSQSCNRTKQMAETVLTSGFEWIMEGF